MKCPHCKAVLMPVDGELFCLQCGDAVHIADDSEKGPALEETADPLLQRAITDASGGRVHFRAPERVSAAPESASGPEKTARVRTGAFAPMRAFLAPPHSVVAAAVGGAAVPGSRLLAPGMVGPAPEDGAAVRGAAKEPPVRVTAAAVGTVTGASVAAAGTVGEAAVVRGSYGWRRRVLPRWWGLVAVVAVVFVAVNAGIFGYFADRVYPGVKVGQVDFGGVPLSAVHDKLASQAPKAKLTVSLRGSKHELDTAKLGAVDTAQVERRIKAAGRDVPLPLAGVVRSLVSQPIAMQYKVNDSAVKQEAARLASAGTHRPADAVPLIVNGQAFVITEKAGSRLAAEKAEQAVRGALGVKSVVEITPDKLEPVLKSAAYSADLDEAQARLALSVQVRVRTKSYSPTPAQIGDWLSFAGIGKGVSVDGSRVAAYVATIPGSFDRRAAVSAITSAVESKQNLSYTAVTRRVTGNPVLPSVASTTTEYTYCTQAERPGDAKGLVDRAQVVLGGNNGWVLGGRLKFVRSDSDCNFVLRIVEPSEMKGLDVACDGHSTCMVGNVIALNRENWLRAPDAWRDGQDVYREEMLNHEVGHWLGFDRTSCLDAKAPKPILQAPTVVLGGCSPNWYEIPADTQGLRVLGGF